MRQTLTFDMKDIQRFEQTCKELGDKTALKAAKKAAQKGSNVVGKAVRKKAPKGETGQLRKGFKKKKEKSKSKAKFVYDYAMDSAKNSVFQKPVKNPGKYGGKKSIAYYPASIEYGFLHAAGNGYRYEPGQNPPSKTIQGTHFTRDAAEEATPKAVETMHEVLNEELDKAWGKS